MCEDDSGGPNSPSIPTDLKVTANPHAFLFGRKWGFPCLKNRQFLSNRFHRKTVGMKKLHTRLKIGLLSLNIHQDIKRKPIGC